MIAIGISPGLKSLVYAVVEFSPGNPATLLDMDALTGPRLPGAGESGFFEGLLSLTKKAYVHHLIMEVVLERALLPIGHAPKPKAVIAFGPPASPKEPPEHVQAVRVMLKALMGRFRVEPFELGEADLAEILSASAHRTFLRYVNAHLIEPLHTDHKRDVLAVMIALGAAARGGELRP